MKGIKTILGVLAAASLLFSVNAFAQENANRDADGNVVRGPYETNGTWDNVYLGFGAGINTWINQASQPNTWGNMHLATDLYLGKWFTPEVGLRAGWHGLFNKSAQALDVQGAAAHERVLFNFVHGDFMWNISNYIGGYKETRLWNFVPYLEMGVLAVNKNLEFAAGPGLDNVIRLNDRWNAHLDINVLLGKEHAYRNAGRFVFWPALNLGLSYTFNKTNFDRHSTITPVVIPVPFTTEQYNDLADKVAALEEENARLRDRVAELEEEVAPLRNLVDGQTYLYENGQFTAVDVVAGSPVTVYFDCGSATLSNRELAHLEYFTNNVVNEDVKLAVNGYADRQTGSARRNQQLSQQRVDYVVNLLTKAGAKSENIDAQAHGATVQLFDGAAKNRVVTIEVIK